MKSLKNIITILIITIFLIIPINTYALSTDSTNFTYKSGDTKQVELYANLDEEVTSISFSLYYTSNDVRADFRVGDGHEKLNGSNHTISFDTPVKGKVKLGTIIIYISNNPTDTGGNINVINAKGYKEDDSSITLDSVVLNITISKNINNDAPAVEQKKEEPKNEKPKEEQNTPTEEKHYNLIKEIKSNIVELNIKDDLYEYSINIDEEVKELDLECIPVEESTKIKIKTQTVKDLEDNKLIIEATDKEGNTQEYIIKVNKNIKVEIDNSKFVAKTSYKSKWLIISVIMIIALGASLLLTKKK